MSNPSTHFFRCDLCVRRKNRLECALKHLEYTRKKSLQDPALSNGFALEGAQRYVNEVRSSHPEHPMNTDPEPEGLQPSKPAPAQPKPDEDDETAALDSEYMVKRSFLKQQEIVERMMEIEKTRGIMIPGGNKHIDTLRKLAVAMMRKEFEQRKSQTDATD